MAHVGAAVRYAYVIRHATAPPADDATPSPLRQPPLLPPLMLRDYAIDSHAGVATYDEVIDATLLRVARIDAAIRARHTRYRRSPCWLLRRRYDDEERQ